MGGVLMGTELSIASPLKKNLDSLEFLLRKPLTPMCT